MSCYRIFSLTVLIFSSYITYGFTKSITSTNTQICAIEKYSQTISCFGARNDTIIPDDSIQFESISSSLLFACGITATDNKMLCWRTGDFLNSALANETGFTKVAAGENHACGLKNQQLLCMGRDDYGQASPPSGNFIDVGAGNKYTCAIDTNGEIQCFGKKYFGDTSWNFSGSAPNETFVELDVGLFYQVCAISTIGDIHCWVIQETGQTHQVREGPFIHVNVHYHGVCGIHTNHTVECWGHKQVLQNLTSSVHFSELSVGVDNACGVENGTNLLKCEIIGIEFDTPSIPNDFEVYMN